MATADGETVAVYEGRYGPYVKHGSVNASLPKGKAPTWNGLGRGNWASAPGYGDRILALFDEALRFSARP